MSENNGEFQNNDTEVRLNVLETKVGFLESTTKTQDGKLEKISNDLGKVSSHIAKQNGAIPHMQEDIKEIKELCQTLSKERHQMELENAKVSTKTKVYLAITALLAAAIAGAILRTFVPVLFSNVLGA